MGDVWCVVTNAPITHLLGADMAALRSLLVTTTDEPPQGLIYERLCFDVHTFLSLYLTDTDYKSLLLLYHQLVTRFMKLCVDKSFKIQPVVMTKPHKVAREQFLTRDRSHEVKSCSKECNLRYLVEYERATENTHEMLRLHFRE